MRTLQPSLWNEESPEKPESNLGFRPIHYLGAKGRFLEPIVNTLLSVRHSAGPICDLFSGSGVVAGRLSREAPVVAVDIQEYSRVLASALLNPSTITSEFVEELRARPGRNGTTSKVREILEPLLVHEAIAFGQAERGDPAALFDLIEESPIASARRGRIDAANPTLAALLERTRHELDIASAEIRNSSFLTAHFGGTYFSYSQALDLDEILSIIDSLSDHGRDLPLAALLSTASSIVNTIGKQFAQPIRPRDKTGADKRHLVKKVLLDRSIPTRKVYSDWLERYATIEQPRFENCAIRSDYSAYLRSSDTSFSAIYADPPYTRDHYSRFYHVLESIVSRDRIGESALSGNASRGMYLGTRHQSPFCIKSLAPSAFQSLFEAARRHSVPLAISYSPFLGSGRSHPRMMTIEGIVELAGECYRSVKVESCGEITHNKFNSRKYELPAAKEAELLIICFP